MMKDIENKNNKEEVKGYLTLNKRCIFEGGVYHVIQRAPGRELLFLAEADNLYFLKLLKETVKRFGLDLFCFALMPNHLHLLLKINEINLSQAMKNLFERYAYYFNKKYKRKGHVFSGRYRASVCNDNNYFLAASVYIHLNPIKANLTNDVKEYRWSSMNLYAASSKESFVNTDYILSVLSEDINKARRRYAELIAEGSEIKESAWMDKRTEKKVVQKVSRTVSSMIEHGKKEEIDDLNRMIDIFKMKKKVLTTEDSNARKYLVQQLLANGFSHGEIIKDLNLSRATFYRIYADLE
ncbi:MAG: hypothetical protein GY853_06545 [PVC group bacterium]|nr:hypothetical protein [PVC group bacterium]